MPSCHIIQTVAIHVAFEFPCYNFVSCCSLCSRNSISSAALYILFKKCPLESFVNLHLFVLPMLKEKKPCSFSTGDLLLTLRVIRLEIGTISPIKVIRSNILHVLWCQ